MITQNRRERNTEVPKNIIRTGIPPCLWYNKEKVCSVGVDVMEKRQDRRSQVLFMDCWREVLP